MDGNLEYQGNGKKGPLAPERKTLCRDIKLL